MCALLCAVCNLYVDDKKASQFIWFSESSINRPKTPRHSFGKTSIDISLQRKICYSTFLSDKKCEATLVTVWSNMRENIENGFFMFGRSNGTLAVKSWTCDIGPQRIPQKFSFLGIASRNGSGRPG